jgi:hypothetical protein
VTLLTETCSTLGNRQSPTSIAARRVREMSCRVDSNPEGSWSTSQAAEDRREKIQALSLAKDCYSMKLDLLTNATVVDDAIRFVASEKSKDKEREQVKSSSSTSSNYRNEDNNKESNEPDYNEDEKSDKEGEEKQKEQTGEITTTKFFDCCCHILIS